MNVRQEQWHGCAFSDFPGFVQSTLRALDSREWPGDTAQPGAREEAAREEAAREEAAREEAAREEAAREEAAREEAAREEAAREVMLYASAAQAGRGLVTLRSC